MWSPVSVIINAHPRECACTGKAGGSVQYIRRSIFNENLKRTPKVLGRCQAPVYMAHPISQLHGPCNPKPGATLPHLRDGDPRQSVHVLRNRTWCKEEVRVMSRQMSGRRCICGNSG